MTCLVEMMSTWLLSILASDILLVLSKSFLKAAGAETHIFTFGEISTIRFHTLPVIYTVPCFTVDRILYLMFVSSEIPNHLGGWGEGEGAAGCGTLSTFFPPWGRSVRVPHKPVTSTYRIET